MSAENLKLLAEGKVSPAIDVYEVYRALFLNEKPEEAYKIYCDPQSFFSITYVTPAFRQYVEDFLKKLSDGKNEIYVMPALMGAGKSHFLAFVLHLLALYRQCNGAGDCVSRKLTKYGIDIEVPSISKVPNVAVFRGRQRLRDFESKLRNTKYKDDLRNIVKNNAPLVIIFDETQFFEIDEGNDFIAWLQTLAEVVREVPEVFLFVSFSLFATERPELERPRSIDVVNRVNPVIVSLDAVSNISAILRRWGGITVRGVDLETLKGLVSEEEYKRLGSDFKQTYPVNPRLLDVVLKLADESLVERTRIQLTRELLRTLARAYLSTNIKGGELITFAHLPEPNDLLIIGGASAELWRSLLHAYDDDINDLKNRGLSHPTYKATLSMLRYTLLATFLSRLMPSLILYPTEHDLLIGSYNNLDASSSTLKEAINEIDRGTHVTKVKDRYIYWFLRDETQVIHDMAITYSENDGLDVAINELINIVENRSGAFSGVYISGINPTSLDRVNVVSDRSSWQKVFSNDDASILSIDVLEFGVNVRKNNLIIISPNNELKAPTRAIKILRDFKMEVKEDQGIKSAIIDIGRIIRTIDEVNGKPLTYFPDLFEIEDETFRKEMEELLKARLDNSKFAARAALKEMVNTWLSKAVIGFNDEQIFNKLDNVLIEVSKRRGEVLNKIAEEILNHDLIKSPIKQGNFISVGDLWSLYLNNSKLPPAPISFNEFLDAIRNYCKGYRCVFKVNDNIVWIPECTGKREISSLDKNCGIAPIFIGKEKEPKEFLDWPVRQFLEKLREMEGGSVRYYIKYKRPSGEEVRISVDEALSEKVSSDWQFFTDGCIEKEAIKAYIQKVLVDGIEQYTIERDPGSKVSIEVLASEEMSALSYDINGVVNRVDLSGVNYQFEVNVPKEPGRHTLSIEVVFKSGGKDQKTVTINIKGKRKKECIKYGVSQGDNIKRIKMLNANEAENLLRYLWGQRKLSLALSVHTEQKVGEGEINLNMRFMVREDTSYNKVLRLLIALKDIAPSVEAVFEFLGPVVVDNDMVQKFRGWRPEFTVICEE